MTYTIPDWGKQRILRRGRRCLRNLALFFADVMTVDEAAERLIKG